MDPEEVMNKKPLEPKNGTKATKRCQYQYDPPTHSSVDICQSHTVPLVNPKAMRRGKSINDISHNDPPKTTRPRRATVAVEEDVNRNSSNTIKNNTSCLSHLGLGDVGESQDMLVLECEPARSMLERFQALHAFDFCFVLRKNRTWTYAIIAEKDEDSITVVVDKKGSVKMIRRARWLDYIRFVNTIDLGFQVKSHEHNTKSPPHEYYDVGQKDGHDDEQNLESSIARNVMSEKDAENGHDFPYPPRVESPFCCNQERRQSRRQSVLSLFSFE